MELENPGTRLQALEVQYANVSRQLSSARLQHHSLDNHVSPERIWSEARITQLVELCDSIRAEIDWLEGMARASADASVGA